MLKELLSFEILLDDDQVVNLAHHVTTYQLNVGSSQGLSSFMDFWNSEQELFNFSQYVDTYWVVLSNESKSFILTCIKDPQVLLKSSRVGYVNCHVEKYFYFEGNNPQKLLTKF